VGRDAETYLVAAVDDFGPGEVRSVPGAYQPVVVVCTRAGEYHAVRSICPHQGAELGLGQLTALNVGDRPGEYRASETDTVLRCPWHSFDFDVATGRCAGDPKMRVRTYPVTVEDGKVLVEI
jgi:nitrite reductase (NADH) small subunit